MKDARLLLMALVTAACLMVFTGCTDAVTTQPSDVAGEALTSGYEPTADLIIPSDIYDGSVENEVRVKENPRDFRDKNDDRRPRFLHGPFDRLLRALKLTEEQKGQVGEFLAAHKECVGAAMQVLRDHVSTIMEEANQARADVIEKLRAGEITREEARAAIREINQRAREALKNSDVIARVREMLKACDEEFIEKLKGILTPEQLEILQRWLDHRGSGDPTGPTDGRRG